MHSLVCAAAARCVWQRHAAQYASCALAISAGADAPAWLRKRLRGTRRRGALRRAASFADLLRRCISREGGARCQAVGS
eukprot:1820156-Pleurochrysis_carterae.AAC.1